MRKYEIADSFLCHGDISTTSQGSYSNFAKKKQRNKALFRKIKHFFKKNKALFRIKIFVNFIFIFQNFLLNHLYCMLFFKNIYYQPGTVLLPR